MRHSSEQTREHLRWTVTAALMAAFITLVTAYVLHVPFPGGYVHIGDTLIYLAACLLPLPYAVAAGAIGAGLADLLTYPGLGRAYAVDQGSGGAAFHISSGADPVPEKYTGSAGSLSGLSGGLWCGRCAALWHALQLFAAVSGNAGPGGQQRSALSVPGAGAGPDRSETPAPELANCGGDRAGGMCYHIRKGAGGRPKEKGRSGWTV